VCVYTVHTILSQRAVNFSQKKKNNNCNIFSQLSNKESQFKYMYY